MPGGAAVWAGRLGCGPCRRGPDLGARDLGHRSQRGEPRIDRGLRILARGCHSPVGRHLDARKVSGRPMAALYSRKAERGALETLVLVPVRARLPGRLSRGVRDHPVLCGARSEEHTSELQSLMRISYAVFCLKKQRKQKEKR